MKDDVSQELSRRKFLLMVGKAGGAAALLQAATLLGLTTAPVQAAPVKLAPLSKKKRNILILGAGISGLTAAYELTKAGYNCKILEASHRAGGRNFTIRHGDFIDELGNPHYCQFDNEPHLYFNAGAARIPAHHTGILHYCRELGVDLEQFCNHNKNCYTHDPQAFDGKPVRLREYEADIRGFMSELLAKSVLNAETLEAPFDNTDRELIARYAKAYGDLNDDFKYQGTSRAGYKSGGFMAPGELKTPHDVNELLKSRFWQYSMQFPQSEDQAPAMFHPVGGMDNIVKAFMREIGNKVQLKAQVKKITLQEKGVEITYFHNGELLTEQADYCLNCIPAQLMPGIENNFPVEYVSILTEFRRGHLAKIGLQARERFWEKEGIYAGISWTAQDIIQIWYPGHGVFKQKGILLGAYTYGPEQAYKLAALNNQQRVELAVEQGSQIHPDYGNYIENGVSVCWHRMNHMLGCAAGLPAEDRDHKFRIIQAPAGHHYMIGDQISYHAGWQEGAVRSAWFALEDIQRRETAGGKA